MNGQFVHLCLHIVAQNLLMYPFRATLYFGFSYHITTYLRRKIIQMV